MISIEKIKNLIIEIKDEKVILDSDVAELYNVETRDINKAVKNNPEKFPVGYILEVTKNELDLLRWKISTAKLSKTRALKRFHCHQFLLQK